MDFSELSKMQSMLSQAKEMQEQMDAKLAESIVEGTAGGGIVRIRMTGRKEVQRVSIQPTVLGSSPADLEMLEDLIAAAFNDALRQADELMQSNTAGMLGGLGLPGLA